MDHARSGRTLFRGAAGQDRRRRDANGKTLDLCRDLRKLGDAELKAIGEHHGAKDDVFQLRPAGASPGSCRVNKENLGDLLAAQPHV